ncbi:crossover junction endodeoxyribonuclease RuvC [Membranihabitans maritimus]|uniref:crossover junction endodeoxyribonuclease RuvC n=1 Tax=Membranihabitans maritimus TaxID=2904244 RepID=UPI001F00F495|nr:crossover junction endodeoxyribonuclease RuvC [Membranihabitans maritimus]
MRILGVDPGSTITGYAIIETNKGNITVLSMGIIKLAKFDNHQTKLKEIFLRIQDVIERYGPEQMAIEAPFYGKNPQSMLKLGRAQGVAIAAASAMDLEIQEFSPKRIKQSVTGNGNASKEKVAGMLAIILKKNLDQSTLDATDALAAAVCMAMGEENRIPSSKGGNWNDFLKNNPGRIISK